MLIVCNDWHVDSFSIQIGPNSHQVLIRKGSFLEHFDETRFSNSRVSNNSDLTSEFYHFIRKNLGVDSVQNGAKFHHKIQYQISYQCLIKSLCVFREPYCRNQKCPSRVDRCSRAIPKQKVCSFVQRIVNRVLP